MIIANLMILAKYTLQIAMVKENITNAMRAANQWFFAFMIDNRVNVVARIRFTITQFVRKTVSIAIAGTKIAFF
jgi:hypothetical protein